MGDYVDDLGNVMPAPGNGRPKRARIDKEGNFVAGGDVYAYNTATSPPTRYNVTENSGASTSVKAFGAVGDGVTDDTAAIQAALDANQYVIVPQGTYRVDSTITVTGGKTLKLDNAILKRFTAFSASTVPIVHVRNLNSKIMGPGQLITENNHPEGIIVAGHRDTTTSNYNSLNWHIHTLNITGVKVAGNIALYIPSSQPVFGFANYFGRVTNVFINFCDKGIVLTQFANAHMFVGVHFQNCITSMYDLTGSLENQIVGGFGHTSTDGVIGVNIRKGASADSIYNSVNGFVFEPGGAASSAYYIDADCQGNTINVVNNAAGGVTVLDARNILFQNNFLNATGYRVGGLQTSPTITSGTGVPAESRPNGSIFLRTDAANADESLYQRIGGAWVPIFGQTA